MVARIVADAVDAMDATDAADATDATDAAIAGGFNVGSPANDGNEAEESPAWIPGENRRWPTSICYPPTHYEWINSFYHCGKMWNGTYVLSAIEAWSYYVFDSDFWKDFHYDSCFSTSHDAIERSLRVPREVLTALTLIIIAVVVGILGDEAGGGGGGEEIVFLLGLAYPLYATIRVFFGNSGRGEIVHWIGYWMAFYLLCVEPASFDFLTYWWMPFRQVAKGSLLLWLVIPRSSRPLNRPLPSPSMAVSEGLRAAAELRDQWATEIVEKGKAQYARISAGRGFGVGGGFGSSGDSDKPGIRGWESLGYALLMSCFYLFLESYH